MQWGLQTGASLRESRLGASRDGWSRVSGALWFSWQTVPPSVRCGGPDRRRAEGPE